MSISFIANISLNTYQGIKFLLDVRRVLKPGGCHRILTPDIRGCVNVFLNEEWKNIPWTQNHKLQTSAEYLNATMRIWGHQFLYDKETLEKYVKECLYSDFSWEEYQASRFKELRDIDTRPASIIIDCIK